MNRDGIIRKTVIDLYSIPSFSSRIVRSKIAKVALANINVSVTPLHFEIIGLLVEERDLPVFEIGKRLVIAKAHMTQLVDKLVEEEMVTRESDPSDRRVILISVTPKGEMLFNEFLKRGRDAMEEALSTLSEIDLEALSSSLSNIHSILMKLC